MTEERYYKLSFLKKTKSGAEWENIYFKVYGNGGLEIINKSINEPSRLEEIAEKEAKKIINDSQQDFSYG